MTFSSSALFVSFGVKNAPWARRMAIFSVAFLNVFYKTILIGGAVPPHTVTRLGMHTRALANLILTLRFVLSGFRA